MTHRGPFQPLLSCDSVALGSAAALGMGLTLAGKGTAPRGSRALMCSKLCWSCWLFPLSVLSEATVGQAEAGETWAPTSAFG